MVLRDHLELLVNVEIRRVTVLVSDETLDSVRQSSRVWVMPVHGVV